MCHRSEASVLVFVEKIIHDNAPKTMNDLCQQLINVPNNKVAKNLMRFGSSLRGIRAYWMKHRSELTHLITQLGCPMLFFTLSATDMKWPDLLTLMPANSDGHALNVHHRKIENVMNYPHIVAMYMHHRFSIFREEII